MKKYYTFLFAGLLVGIIALGFKIYAAGDASQFLKGSVEFSYISLLFQTLAGILGFIGLIGMVIKLLKK